MALSATTIWELRAAGSDNSSGGFNPGNANFPADLTTNTNTGNTSTPVLSSASYTFVAGDVGAWVFIKSGTNWIPGWYKITSVAAGKATVDAAIGHAVLYSTTALPSLNTVAGVSTVGTPTAGTYGVDYSQQNTAAIAFTDIVIGATNTTFTSAAHPVGKNFVGNLIQITAGTGFTVGFYEIVSTAGTVATCDRALGTANSTGGSGNLGGALGTPTKLASTGGPIVSSNVVWVNGIISVSTGVTFTATTNTHWEGYSSIRSDDGIGTFKATAAIVIFTSSNNTGSTTVTTWRHLEFDGNSLATGGFVSSYTGGSTYMAFYDCSFHNISGTGLLFNPSAPASGIVINCRSNNNTIGFKGDVSGNLMFYGCQAYSNSSHGFQLGDAALFCCSFCQSYSNGGNGFAFDPRNGGSWLNCTAYGNTADGWGVITTTQDGDVSLVNCIGYNNGGWGFNYSATTCLGHQVINCAFGANTSGGIRQANALQVGIVSLTGDPFVNAAGGNFALNNTAGAGAACRAAGFPGTFPNGLTVGKLDIGSAQHADPTGTGGRCSILGSF